MNLKEFCLASIDALSKVEKEHFVTLFIHLRYDVLSQEFPHPVFGANRTTGFFEDTLKYLGSPSALDTALKEAKATNQLYEIRYLEWVKSHAKTL